MNLSEVRFACDFIGGLIGWILALMLAPIGYQSFGFLGAAIVFGTFLGWSLFSICDLIYLLNLEEKHKERIQI